MSNLTTDWTKTTADRIAKTVLTKTYLKSCGGIDLIRMCACQHGTCGHCGDGKHERCTTWVGFEGKPRVQPETHLVGRRNGAALTKVWTTGKPCRWVCACERCANDHPVKVEPAPRQPKGDMRPGDTVWLTPKTLGCPAICWKQPKAVVERITGMYVEVTIGKQNHRIHRDNIRRSNPQAAKSVVTVRPRPRPPMPDGYTEQSLF